MLIFIPKETFPGESRIPLVPSTADKLVKLGAQLEIESGIGLSLGIPDEAYQTQGGRISDNRELSLSRADMVLRLRKPPREEINRLKTGCIHISFLDPFREGDLIRELVNSGISAISMELIPRTTLAQKMDALSSQANLAGYAACILAAERLHKVFPMMMTPAGTLQSARVFVIGAGVAGLQAIATAKRLGARVEAFDTRPTVEQEVKSLGAKFVKVDLGETGQTKEGYAKALTSEQLNRQREVMTKHCALADIVITTAQVFGKKAPLIVTTDMVQAMKPGSVIVDMAVETGGNVEGSKQDEEILIHGARVIGFSNLPAKVSDHASQMYSNNLGNLVEHFWDKGEKAFKLNLEDEIIRSCLVTHNHKILNETVKKVFQERGIT